MYQLLVIMYFVHKEWKKEN